MKHVFVVNPAAGNGKGKEEMISHIVDVCENKGVSYDIYRTGYREDATRFVSEFDISDGESARFYSCGGDGTLNEVVNGVMRRGDRGSNCEVAMIPVGSGNDFPKCFQGNDLFCDLEAQINGEASPIDVIGYKCDDKAEKYAVNIFNMGFDSVVVEKSEQIRRKSFFSGPLSYTLGVVYSLFKMPHADLDLEIDGKEKLSGKYLLAVLANGTFYGGGYKASPFSILNDGKLNLVLVKNMTRLKFISLVKKYKEGTAYATETGKKLITYMDFKSARLISKIKTMICIDGELSSAKELLIKIVPGALNFSVPKAVKI